MTPRRSSSQDNDKSGSPPTGEPVFLAVGKLRRPHGVHGEIQMDVLTDFPERLVAGVMVYAGTEHRPLRLKNVRPHDQVLLLTFGEFTTPEAVGELRNQVLFVRADDRPPLPEGEYYHHELIGLRVVDENGNVLGKLTEILETGANDVYLVRPDTGSDILLPAIEDVILAIDLTAGEMRVHLLPGLLAE